MLWLVNFSRASGRAEKFSPEQTATAPAAPAPCSGVWSRAVSQIGSCSMLSPGAAFCWGSLWLRKLAVGASDAQGSSSSREARRLTSAEGPEEAAGTAAWPGRGTAASRQPAADRSAPLCPAAAMLMPREPPRFPGLPDSAGTFTFPQQSTVPEQHPLLTQPSGWGGSAQH